jgi:hypothetical protein
VGWLPWLHLARGKKTFQEWGEQDTLRRWKFDLRV